MSERRWTITVDQDGEARALGDVTGTAGASAWEAVVVVPASERATPRSELRRIAHTTGDCPICGSAVPAEITDAMVERALGVLTGQALFLKPDEMRAALTAALHGGTDG